MPFILGEKQPEERIFSRADLLSSPKIKSLEKLQRFLRTIKMTNANARIGFTNGKFRYLHAGHAVFLNLCKTRCTFLVVGINADDSAYLSSSSHRVPPLDERMFTVSQVPGVDFVTSFSEETPEQIICSLDFIDVVFKGPDYKREEVVSAGRSVEIIQHPLNVHVSDLEKVGGK